MPPIDQPVEMVCVISQQCNRPVGAKAAIKQLGMERCQELIDYCSSYGKDDRCDCMYFAVFGGFGAK